MDADAIRLAKERNPAEEDYRGKTERHRGLQTEVGKILNESTDFLNHALPKVAQLLANRLEAECVGVFFRRKSKRALRRCAIAINEHWQDKIQLSLDLLPRDTEYKENKDRTLMWPPQNSDEPYAKQREEGIPLNLGPREIRALTGDIKTIVDEFEKTLGFFEHLIIVQIRLFDKLLGAIRVVNHLNPFTEFAISKNNFTDEQDVTLVGSIGHLLALAYGNHRKSEKVRAQRQLSAKIRKADSEKEAVTAFLSTLVSDEMGFPLALWRIHKRDGSSEIKWDDSSHEEKISLVPANFALQKGQGPELKDGRAVIRIQDHEKYREWLSGYNLESMYIHKVPWSDGTYATLEVFAEDSREFDDDLTQAWIENNAELLESQLARIGFEERVNKTIAAAGIVGDCLTDQIKRAIKAAKNHVDVLLLGASGTGKGRFARFIHDGSGRTGFVTLHCGTLSEDLLKSELFGHKKGTFTGAIESTTGKLVIANGGTIFLDDIDTMSEKMQEALLHFLQEHEVVPVGATEPIKVDVCVIAATNADLVALVEAGKFRKDLYFRLKGVEITLPPLKTRKEDILKLADRFLQEFANDRKSTVYRIDDEAKEALASFDWPGNVRELKKAVETAVAMAESDVVNLDDLPEDVQKAWRRARAKEVEAESANEGMQAETSADPIEALEEMKRAVEDQEKVTIKWALEVTGGNEAAAARKLGMPRQSFQRLREKHGV